jgi:dihydrofolate reductase
MIISIIAAVAENSVIGANNQLIWHLPEDLKYFKKITMGKYILMGRKTWESIGKPLPGRTNIIITKNPDYKAEGCLIFHSLHEAVDYSESQEQDEIFIIGGGKIYRNALKLTNKIYLTKVHTKCRGDAFFPELNNNEWEIIDKVKYKKDDRHPYDFDMLQLIRKTKNQ